MGDADLQPSTEDMARAYLLCYAVSQFEQYQIAKHHQVIAAHLEALERREIKRLLITMAPRHGKTYLASEFFSAWYMGRHPEHEIMFATYSKERAMDIGLKVKQQLESDAYQNIFTTELSTNSKSKAHLATTGGGAFYAVGVGGAMTGRGANLFLMDDLVKSREDAESEVSRKRLLEWYRGTAYTRLQPNGVICLIMCVAEGERVLMGDGTWRKIETISANDYVIGYDNKKPVKKKVMKASCSGEDDIIEVVSRSCTLRVNKQHPFLVVKGGLQHAPTNRLDVIASREWDLEWVPAGELKPKDIVVTIKSLQSSQGTRPFNGYNQKQQTSDDYWLLGFLFGEGWLINNNKRGVVGFCVATSDKPKLDLKVKTLLEERFGANLKKTKYGYLRCDSRPIGRWLASVGLSSGAHTKRLPEWLFKVKRRFKKQFLQGFFAADGWERTKGAFYVHICNKDLLDDLRLLSRTCGFKTSKIYTQHYMAQPPNSPEPFLATGHNARFYDKSYKTELKGRYRLQGDLGTYFRLEAIDSVTPCGRSKVYDLTVDGAESFIAEGFVVHNTRWHNFDLAGTIISEFKKDWVHLDLPAICEKKRDSIGRKRGEALWPEMFSLKDLKEIRKVIGSREFNAQYQQRPIGEEGSIIKLDWFNRYVRRPSQFRRIIQSWDTAYDGKSMHDPSVCTVWGEFVDRNSTTYFLLDVWRQRVDYPIVKKAIFSMYQRWPGTHKILVENRTSGKSIVKDLQQTNLPILPILGQGSKEIRAMSVSGLIESGKVCIPETAKWLYEFENEVVQFPLGKHDDQVDSMTQALEYLKKPSFYQSIKPQFWK